jgi:endonuclease YncB( thermonuclease family)
MIIRRGIALAPVNDRVCHNFISARLYIYYDDGTMLNAELIRRGYAHAYTRFPFRHVAEFRQLESIARSQAAGLWASCQLKSP